MKRRGHIVELGWRVAGGYPDLDPHLFVYHWIDWVPTCYDRCGWQQWSGTYFPGVNLSAAVGREVYVGYVFWQDNWWAWFDNQWRGYFSGSVWSGEFTRSTLMQWSGEVASHNGVPPLTDMGNGRRATNTNATSMSALCDVAAADWTCWIRDRHAIDATRPRYYDIVRTGFGRVRFGGPGE